MENTCNFVGYVRHMSDINESSKGNHYCRFTLDNIVHGYHNYIRMILFGTKAENFVKKISDGDLIYVDCEMQINVYESQVRYSFLPRDYHVIDLNSGQTEEKKESPSESNDSEVEEKPKIKKISDDDLRKAYDETINEKDADNTENEHSAQQDDDTKSSNDFFSHNDEEIDKEDEDFFNKF